MTAVRRPDLLARTLEDFDRHLRPGWPDGPVFVNVDPAMGTEADQAQAVEVIRRHFPNAEVFEPEAPGFGAAVTRLWSRVPDGPVLHLEDDWRCLAPIDLEIAADWLDHRVRMVSFVSVHHGRKGERDFSEKRTRVSGLRRLWAAPRIEPLFNTGPALADGVFLRELASRMDPALDPEKQMRRPANPTLNDWLGAYRCRFLKAPDGGALIHDTGRDWRDEQGIIKVVEVDRSSWTKK
ncbi:hypothetical protein [Jannaschia rubra]|uniref:hypothetical protein n=1 Tax=Jannaschia rubra TaxID=282197 RepID=UPI0011604540|nr:hypothetical protein [Jannaschia rubra]